MLFSGQESAAFQIGIGVEGATHGFQKLPQEFHMGVQIWNRRRSFLRHRECRRAHLLKTPRADCRNNPA